MIVVSVQEAERDFARVLDHVLSGEEVVIASGSREVAIVSPAARPSGPRVPGTAKGRISISSDFDKPLPRDVLGDFEQ
ncbi:MAG: type II toxin-antitoxin system Phd/YefM family antitoxin [Armatimonadetes bacterium]|nr:type II toxin-antitoxin system Phd/YefM family antitoxin [Armatimonadota bacterium]